MDEKDLEKYSGIEISTYIYAKKRNDGKWEVKQTLGQKRSEDLKTWEEKNMEINAVDADLNRAIGETNLSIAMYLDLVDGDLFNEPVSTLDKKDIQ